MNRSRDNIRLRDTHGTIYSGADIRAAYELAVAGGLELDAADNAEEMADALENYGIVEWDDTYGQDVPMLTLA